MHARFLHLENGIEQLSREWFAIRKGRLTGSKLSNFCFIKDEDEYHDYYSVIYEGAPRPPFTKEQLGYMEYGREHEDIATCCFLNDAPKDVGDIYIAESPFYKHTDPTVGASPDGTYAIFKDGNVIDEGVIEIKCPGKKPNRPYTKWKYYYVPQTYWEMACSGHKNAITISWGPRNMRAWRYEWDDNYWRILCNIVKAFRDHVPYKEFQILQAELIQASHDVANNAKKLHPGTGWKQFAHNIVRIREILKTNSTKADQPKIPKKEAVSIQELEKKDKKDFMWAEVIFHPGTDWYKNTLSTLVDDEDINREFVIMNCDNKYTLVPGYSSKGEVKIDKDNACILRIKYYD